MKKSTILLSVVLILTTNMLFGQEDGSYKQVPELNNYEGTWQWQSNDSIFTICLVKTVFNLKKMLDSNPNASVDVIIGWYEFKVRNKVIQSSLNLKNKKYDYNRKNQTFVASLQGDYLRISSFYELSNNVKVDGGTFTLIEGGKKAILRLLGNKLTIPSNDIILQRIN